MDFSTWIPTAVLVAMLFFARNWIKARIESSVRNEFDSKLETLRTELRKSEETFKSELRSKESEISALRDGVLSGRLNRQALLDKRRMDAVEKLWKAVVDLAPYKFLSSTMAIVKFDEASKEASRNPNFRKIFEMLGNIPNKKFPDNAAMLEQPFVSPMSWACFSAYQTVLALAFAQMKFLELGIEDPEKYLKTSSVEDLLKIALPHQSPVIDQFGSAASYYLLDELEQKILNELRKMLQGEDVDEASITQSTKIMALVQKVRTESEELNSKVGKIGPESSL